MSNSPTDPNNATVGLVGSSEVGLKGPFPKLVALTRAYIRDFPELNRLIEGHETSDRMIAFALMDTLDDWNSTPPLIEPASLESFPSFHLLIRGSIIRILESVGLLQTRNQLTYSDGQGIQVSVSDKSPQLISWINLFTNQYEQKKFRLKQALNLRGALNQAAVPSEYRYINGNYDEFV